jgi:uncharacterized protein YhdP
VTGLDHGYAWAVLAGLIIVARLLMTRVALRFLRPRLTRLAEWWMARPRPRSEAEIEFEELWAVRRRQELTDSVVRLRRIIATDESMSATRQIANRIAYRGLLRDLESIPDVLPWMPYDDAMISRYSSGGYGSRRDRSVEILEIGPRR